MTNQSNISKHLQRAVFCILIVCAILPLNMVQGQTRLNPVNRLEDMLEKGSTPQFLCLKKDSRIRIATLFTTHRDLFQTGDNDHFVNLRVDESIRGLRVYRFQQYYRNLPVDYANLIVHEQEGYVTHVIGQWVSGLNLNNRPVLTEAIALQKALLHINSRQYAWELSPAESVNLKENTGFEASWPPQGVLCIVNEKLDNSGLFRLAWRFGILSVRPFDSKVVYVDASNGNILHEITNMRADESHAVGEANTLYSGNRSFYTTFFSSESGEDNHYFLKDSRRGQGIITMSLQQGEIISQAVPIKNATNEWTSIPSPPQYGPDVHWAMQKTFDYFLYKHNRNSYNNLNGPVTSYINYKNKFNNALWTGPPARVFLFGDGDGAFCGPIAGLDLVAHEFTHAVTDHSVVGNVAGTGLLYQAESGAIDEGIADIFGTMVEFFSKYGNWTMGEGFCFAPARSLASPKAFFQPTTYGGENYITPVPPYGEANDYGGVHTNCSVMSHWFYLLSVGGSGVNDNGDEFKVEPVGTQNAARITYHALTHSLNANTDFAGMRTATVNAAKFFNGNDECAHEVVQVKNAWHAVGVGDGAMYLKEEDIQQPSCGKNNGYIGLTIGGVPMASVTFAWSSGEIDFYITDKAVGTYSVTITDPNSGCTIEKDYDLEEAFPIFIRLTTTDESACNSDDGTASAYVELDGNVTPQYQWSNGAGTFSVNNLPPGDYSLTVTNPEDDCQGKKEFTILPWRPKVTIRGAGQRTKCPDDPTVKLSGENCGSGVCKWYRCTSNDCSSSHLVWIGDGPDIGLIEDGKYKVILIRPEGCTGEDTASASLKIKNCSEKDDEPRWKIPVFYPRDPNEISGPAGFGPAQFVASAATLPYKVYFENDPEFATAPATKIHIELPVDQNFNLYSFRLGTFSFANMHFSPPANATWYTDRLDVRDSLGVFVDLTAGIDVAARKVFWTFQAIDPATGLQPVDPLMGFLPVNDTATHIGEGFVSFTLNPGNNVVTGDTVLAHAAIIFDLNEAILTNTWKNTMDALPPASFISAFSSQTDSTTIQLSISGSDDPGGSGIAFYTVYVAENAGPFMKLDDYAPGQAVLFSGKPGDTYRFFSLGTDNTGQRENMKTDAEAQVSFHSGQAAIQGSLSYLNDAASPLDQVKLQLKNLTGLVRDSATTGTYGEFSLSPPAPGSYMIHASTSKAWGGGNAADALRVLRHFVELDTLTGLMFKAGDINLTGQLNASDALGIATRFVNPSFIFPAGDWQFEKDTLVFGVEDLAYSFRALCTGDIDGSYNPPSGKPQPAIRLFQETQMDIRAGEISDIPLTVDRDADIGAISLVIRYEADKVALLDVIQPENRNGNLTFTAGNGLLRIAWYSLQPLTAEAGDVLLYLRLRALDMETGLYTLFSSEPESALADAEGNEISNINLFLPRLRLDIPLTFNLMQNQPNPFVEHTLIRFTLPENARVMIRLIDPPGKEILQLMDEEKTKGSYSIRLDGSVLGNGVYFAELTTDGASGRHKALIRMVKAGN